MARMNMCHPDYVYTPWSDERRFRASENARAKHAGLPKLFPHTDPKVEMLANRSAIERLLYAPENIWKPKPKPLKVKKPKLIVSRAKVVLAYPFIPKARGEHADLVAVNALVPRGLPGREDVCQEIMLAIWEGQTTLDELRANRANITAFIKRFRTDNLEQGGFAISLDAPIGDGGTWHDILRADQGLWQ